MKTNYILIDYENVQIRSLERLQGSQFKVLVFLGPNNTRLPVELVLSVQRMGEHASYVAMEAGGTNALDFHIAYYIGHLSSTDPSAFFHIISKDTGFDPLIQHLKGRKIFAARSISIDEMPCFKTPSSTSTGNPPSQTLATIASAPDAANKPESLLRPVLEDLIKRKASKPRAVKTLKSTPPRQNSCHLDRILNSGAMMRERVGAIRTRIQRQSGGAVAAAGERSGGVGCA